MIRSRRMGQLVSTTLVAGVGLGILAGPAPASTAQLMDVPDPSPCGKYYPEDCSGRVVTLLVYEAGRGEANRIGIAAREGNVRIRDLGATIQAGRGCSRTGRHEASCEIPAEGFYVATRDRADRVRGDDIGLFVDGGAGDDVLVGGSGDDLLFGGRGADVLSGRAGLDVLYDAAPARLFRAGDQSPFRLYPFRTGIPIAGTFPLANPGRGRDRFDGGTGRNDQVSYEGRSAGVRVDLATRARVAGQRGERDAIAGIEDAAGGAGDDRLAGDRRRNQLRGGPGDDRIAGRDGDDWLGGDAGRNAFSGGPGNDSIAGSIGQHERIACGPGKDDASSVDEADFVGDDCESLAIFQPLAGGLVKSLLPLREGRPPTVLVTTVGCPFYSACQGRLELRVEGPGARGGRAPARGSLLGCERYGPAPGGPGRTGLDLSLGLSSAGLATVRRFRALRVRVVFTRVDAIGGEPLPAGYVTVLRTPLRAAPRSTRARPPRAVGSAACE